MIFDKHGNMVKPITISSAERVDCFKQVNAMAATYADDLASGNPVTVDSVISFLLPADEQFTVPSAVESKRMFGGMFKFLTHKYDSENKGAK